MGYVQQEPALILGTIRENMLFGNANANEDDIWTALKRANAGFVNEIEGKIDAYIGSSAVMNLSGG